MEKQAIKDWCKPYRIGYIEFDTDSNMIIFYKIIK